MNYQKDGCVGGVRGLLICYFIVPMDKKKEDIRNEMNSKDDISEKGGKISLEHCICIALRWIVHVRVV